ncbi:MAG TPA: hypothetical protein VNG53_06160 [Bacteroidia bacterium]|nr:hypothetical protein [Bacteroidia bacterium]
MQSIIKKYQTKKKRNIVLLTALLILCFIVWILVIIFHKPLLWTTTFGEILIVSGFISGITLKLNSLKNVTKNELKSNKAFLEDLIKVSGQKKAKANWHILFPVLLLAIGYGFFIYEEIKDNQAELILSYFGIALYILVMYFIFRPFIKRNSKNKTKKMLEAIENLK